MSAEPAWAMLSPVLKRMHRFRAPAVDLRQSNIDADRNAGKRSMVLLINDNEALKVRLLLTDVHRKGR